MCPVCWLFPVLSFLGLGGNVGVLAWVQANGWLAMSIAIIVSIIFWIIIFVLFKKAYHNVICSTVKKEEK